MIEFAPGSSHTATLPIAVAPAGLACEVELWLSLDGETKAASSGLVPFTSTGSQQQITLPVDMPSEEGTYQVLIDVYCEGNLVGAYQAIDDVKIAEVFELIPDPDISGTGEAGLPEGTQPYDCFVGAELSIKWYGVTVRGNETTLGLELNLIDGNTVIPIVSASRYWGTAQTSHPQWYFTVPDYVGTYDLMIRVYRDGVLSGQYPYIGTITIVPKGVSNFAYTKPTWDIWWDGSLPMYVWETTCTITNKGSVAERNNVILWLRVRDSEQPATEWNTNLWRRRDEFVLELAPGEVYNYRYRSYPNGNPGISGHEYGLVQLRDSDGGVSPKSTEKRVE